MMKILVNIFKKSTEQQQQQGIQDLSEILKKKTKTNIQVFVLKMFTV